jgi:hypothetical protein
MSTVGNGDREKTVKYRTIIGTVCDKNDSTVGRANLRHVALSPKMRFSLGNSDLMCVEKNDMKLKFDIEITNASAVV